MTRYKCFVLGTACGFCIMQSMFQTDLFKGIMLASIGLLLLAAGEILRQIEK